MHMVNLFYKTYSVNWSYSKFHLLISNISITWIFLLGWPSGLCFRVCLLTWRGLFEWHQMVFRIGENVPSVVVVVNFFLHTGSRFPATHYIWAEWFLGTWSVFGICPRQTGAAILSHFRGLCFALDFLLVLCTGPHLAFWWLKKNSDFADSPTLSLRMGIRLFSSWDVWS